MLALVLGCLALCAARPSKLNSHLRTLERDLDDLHELSGDEDYTIRPRLARKISELPEEEYHPDVDDEEFTTETQRESFVCTPDNTIDMTTIRILEGGSEDFKIQDFPVSQVVEAWDKVDPGEGGARKEWFDRETWQTLFRPNEPKYSDVLQGNIGDCYMLASLKAILSKPWGPRYVTQVLNFHHNTVYVPVFKKSSTGVKKSWRAVEPRDDLGESEYLGRLRAYAVKRCLVFPLKVITSDCGKDEPCLVGANRHNPNGVNWVNLFETGFMYFKYYKTHKEAIDEKFESWKTPSVLEDEDPDEVQRAPLQLGNILSTSLEMTMDINRLLPDVVTGQPLDILKNLFNWYAADTTPEKVKGEERRILIERIRGDLRRELAPLTLHMISAGYATDVDPLFFSLPEWLEYALSNSEARLNKIRTFSENVAEGDYFKETKVTGEKTVELRVGLYSSKSSKVPDAEFELHFDSLGTEKLFVPVQDVMAYDMSTPVFVVTSGDLPPIESDAARFARSAAGEKIAWCLTAEKSGLNCAFDLGGEPLGIFMLNNEKPATDPISLDPVDTAEEAIAQFVTNRRGNPLAQVFTITKNDADQFVRTEFEFIRIDYKLAVEPQGMPKFYIPQAKLSHQDMRGVVVVDPKVCPDVVAAREELANAWLTCPDVTPATTASDPPSCVQHSFSMIQTALTKGQVAMYASTRPNSEVPKCCLPIVRLLKGYNGESMCTGLAYGHAYALLAAKEIEVSGSPKMFLLLSNPWGNTGRRYTTRYFGAGITPQEARLEDQHGNFWIEMMDFMLNFDMVFGFSLDAMTTSIMTAATKNSLHLKPNFNPETQTIGPIIA